MNEQGFFDSKITCDYLFSMLNEFDFYLIRTTLKHENYISYAELFGIDKWV